MSTMIEDTTDLSTEMALLGAGVPLTLLLDLATIDVSLSRDIARTERADASWVHFVA